MNSADWAAEYARMGWAAIALKPGTKRPASSAWQDTKPGELTEVDEDDNLGVVLGSNSGGLVNVDLDCDEAAAAASSILPATLQAGHGVRAPRALHYYFTVNGTIPKYRKYTDSYRKAITKSDRHCTILELRGDSRQNAVAPSKHPDYEGTYGWVNWGTPALTIASEGLQRQAALLAATALLGRYWPSSGIRNDAAMALTGALLRYPALKDTDFDGTTLLEVVAYEVMHIGGDEEATSRMGECVARTMDIFEQGKKVTGLPTLLDLYGSARMAVEEAFGWLDEVFERDEYDEQEESEGLGSPVDLASIIEHGIPPTDWLIEGLLIRGKFHLLASDGGKGKSLMSMWMAREVIRKGGSVMVIDEENDVSDIAERTQALGMSLGEVRRLTYFSHVGLDVADRDVVREVGVMAAAHDLLIVDSFWDLMAYQGWDPNSHQEVGKMMKVIESWKRKGNALLVLDHVPKNNAKDFVGAGVKKAAVHAGFTLHINRAWDRSQGGNGKLYRVKGRGGEYKEETQFTVVVNPTEGTLNFEWPDLTPA